ncbi:MAG TPA: transposase [Cytophagales bacterium]|nr:transposase [Cytophagales bacterium]HCR52851.1 transposase [Cytophagales bacterium]
MSRKYKFSDNDQLYFITFTVVGWVDIFIRKEYKDILLDSWRYCQKEKDLEIYAWCIMTSHVHMIVGSKGRALDKIIGEMKSFTSRSLRKAIESNQLESRRKWMISIMKNAGLQNGNNRDWQLWQQHNHPIELVTEEMFYQKLEYIHRNPVKAGFVKNEEDYLYSSAMDFYDKKGLIELCYIV